MKGQETTRGALTAVLLSGLILPGLGQLYQGRLGRGIAMMAATLACMGIVLVRVASGAADLIKLLGERAFSAGEILETLQTLYRGLGPVASRLLIVLVFLWVISVLDACFNQLVVPGARRGGRDLGPR